MNLAIMADRPFPLRIIFCLQLYYTNFEIKFKTLIITGVFWIFSRGVEIYVGKYNFVDGGEEDTLTITITIVSKNEKC